MKNCRHSPYQNQSTLIQVRQYKCLNCSSITLFLSTLDSSKLQQTDETIEDTQTNASSSKQMITTDRSVKKFDIDFIIEI